MYNILYWTDCVQKKILTLLVSLLQVLALYNQHQPLEGS
jgi:hypothetical protein